MPPALHISMAKPSGLKGGVSNSAAPAALHPQATTHKSCEPHCLTQPATDTPWSLLCYYWGREQRHHRCSGQLPLPPKTLADTHFPVADAHQAPPRLMISISLWVILLRTTGARVSAGCRLGGARAAAAAACLMGGGAWAAGGATKVSSLASSFSWSLAVMALICLPSCV